VHPKTLVLPRRISPIVAAEHPRAEAINAPLAGAFAALGPEDFERRSHFIDGRFENLYLNRAGLPGLDAVLSWAEEQARTILTDPGGAFPLPQEFARPPPDAPLHCGFWLNAMEPGQHTSRHSHAENDELVSGVYYVEVPPKSGAIRFHDDPFEVRVVPTSGLMLLFPPTLVHAVERNLSRARRLSIAFNLGPGRGP
jgi:hypothetical protein